MAGSNLTHGYLVMSNGRGAAHTMGEAALWSWSEAAGKAHLEVRAATRGEGPVVRIDGPVARADRDWIYWRLPTVVTAEAFDCSRPEASVRLDRGNVRVGALTADVRLGENWCEPTLVGKAFFLDAFFGVLRDGDAITAQSPALKAAMGDVITVRLLVEAGVVEFLINSASVGKVPVDPRREMKVAVQMWDKGDCVYLVGAKEKVRASKSKEHDASNTSFGQSPIKSAAATPRVPALGVEPTVSHPSKHSPSATPPSVRSRGTPRRQAGIVSGDKREPSSTSNGHKGGEGGHAAEGQQETAAVLPSVDPLSSEEHGEAMGLPSTQLSQHEVEQNGGSGDDVAGAQEEIAAGSSSLDGELPSAPIPSDQVLDRPDSSSGIATEGAPQPSSSAEDGAEEDGGGVYDGSGLTPAALEAHGKDNNDEAKNEEAALASEIPDGGASTEVESSHAPAQEFSTAGEENHSAAVSVPLYP